jgi:hypothetical protein
MTVCHSKKGGSSTCTETRHFSLLENANCALPKHGTLDITKPHGTNCARFYPVARDNHRTRDMFVRANAEGTGQWSKAHR